MTHVVLFPSVLGLRAIERDIAREWEAAGHRVILPDLYDGRSAEEYDDGFAIAQEIGREEITARAAAAVDAAPADAVLAGVSMGAAHVGRAWSRRPQMPGAILIAGACDWDGVPEGLPVSAHIARPDPFDDEAYFEAWVKENPGAKLDLHRYDGGGHYFLDPALPDYHAGNARQCRDRMLAFLNGL